MFNMYNSIQIYYNLFISCFILFYIILYYFILFYFVGRQFAQVQVATLNVASLTPVCSDRRLSFGEYLAVRRQYSRSTLHVYLISPH